MEAWLLSNYLILKHIFADYYIQVNFMFKDKHKYGSWGGVSHAGVHGLLTALCFTPFVSVSNAFLFGLLDFIAHYHIDYVKSNYTYSYPMQPSEHKYWVVHGTDQLFHILTYMFLVWLFFEQII
tara:strand:+ start:2638 stop:3009 length:372 start_codon:yes stop_codon:yes gene_type:complete